MGSGALNFLHRYSVRQPAIVLALAAAVTAAISPGILRLRLRTDGHALIPENASAVRIDREVRREFGVEDPVVVLIRPRHPDGIFNPPTLQLVADLTRAFAAMPEIDSARVRSLATEACDRFRPGTLIRRRLLEPVPETREQIEELRGDIAAIGLLTGTLVSFDHRATAILVGMPSGVDRTPMLSRIEHTIASADTAGHEVDVIGAPAAESLLGLHILEDLGVSSRWWKREPSALASRSDEGLGALSRMRLAVASRLGLLPLSIAVMALVFLFGFRSFTATLLPLAEALGSLVFVFGLMGWTGVPVYLTMAVLPVILVSMGLADEIHVFTAFRRARAARPHASAAEVVSEAMDEMSLPVVATSMTTAVGFLSFAVSPLAPVRAFGVFTAVGIVFCMVWTLTVIPALLVLLAPAGFRGPSGADRASGWWRMLADRFGGHPRATLAAAALAFALMPFGIRKLAVQDSWISGFAEDSSFYRATQYFNRHFYGTHLLLLALDAGRLELHGTIPETDLTMNELRIPGDRVSDPGALVGCSLVLERRGAASAGVTLPGGDYHPGSWESTVENAERREGGIVLRTPLVHGSARFLMMPAPGETLEYTLRSHRLALPAVLRKIDGLERYLRTESRHAVGGALGPADQIATAAFLAAGRAEELRGIPSNPERLSWLWSELRLFLGPRRMGESVDPGLDRCLVTVFLKNANYVDTARLMESIRAYELRRLAPEHIRLEFAGDVAVSQALIQAIVDSQIRSIVGSLLGILAVTAILFRSLRWGVICTVPAALSVATTFAVMGWAGMPLGVATSMFAGMALGIGVDFAIHVVERYRLAVARGAPGTAGIAESLAATGPAILINALAVALGFGILVLSQVPANAWLGAITVLSLTTCVIATLLVTPALLRLAGGSSRDA